MKGRSMQAWYKVWCPYCQKPNWVNDGDPNDCTAIGISKIRCCQCDQIFPFHDDIDEPEDGGYIEKGVDSP